MRIPSLIPYRSYPTRFAEITELLLKEEGGPKADRGWASLVVHSGIESLLIGNSDLAQRCLRVGVKCIVPPLEEANRQVYTPNIVVSKERSVDATSGAQQLSQVVQLGFTAFNDGYLWRSAGLAHWLLDAADDTRSFRRAADILWQYYSGHPDELRDGMALDDLGPILLDAGLFDECIRCVSDGKYFKEPQSPAGVRAPRTLAYVLSRHHKEAWWSHEQVRRATETMLKVNVPKWTHGQWEHLAHWMKIAFWNEQRATMTPVEALRKCIEYIP